MADPPLTLLAIAEIGVPPYSARGLTQTLVPIALAQSQRRTVNGALVDLSVPQFRKYVSVITCTDQESPALDGVWPGRVLTVDCVCELCYLTEGGSPQRTVVPGSSRVEGLFTWYRPRIVFQVATPATISTDEYGAAVNFTLNLEEV